MKSQAESDLWNEQERFMWAFRGMEYNGFPFLAPEEVFREWSEHLSKCGFIHVSQLEDGRPLPKQQIHYQPPVRGEDHDLNGFGSWVSVDEPIKPSMIPAVASLTPAEQAILVEDLKREGVID